MENEEIWKAVSGYIGLYEVSNTGRVRSLSRVVPTTGGTRISKGKILKGSINNHGYPTVNLCFERRYNTKNIHMLVACAFLNHIPDGHKIVVDHIDGIKTHNRVENLRIVTQRFNLSFGKRKNDGTYTSQYVGVRLRKGDCKWEAQIKINGISKCLGRFTNELDAAIAYKNELLKI